jgi:hypothetical protein
MGKILVTQSLLSSWKYQFDCRDGCEEQARQDFMDTLNRIDKPETEAMAAGKEFENVVTDILNGQTIQAHDEAYVKCAGRAATYLTGAQLQVKGYKDIWIDGLPFLLYGRLDGLKAGVIYDIKFSGSYEVGKYYDSYQHPMYFELVPAAEAFVYLVSDGRRVWTERYYRGEGADIYKALNSFLAWLRVYGLLDLYLEKWGGDT